MRVSLRPAALAGAAGAVVLAASAGWIATRVTAERALTRELQGHLGRVVRLGAERLRASQELPLDSVVSALATTTQYRTSVFDGETRLVADPQLTSGDAAPEAAEGEATEGETAEDSAKRCGIANSTSFRWRHRFLDASRQDPGTLRGIVEADETYLLQSRKGRRNMVRLPRRRGGKAKTRGLSKDLAPILFAADGRFASCPARNLSGWSTSP